MSDTCAPAKPAKPSVYKRTRKDQGQGQGEAPCKTCIKKIVRRQRAYAKCQNRKLNSIELCLRRILIFLSFFASSFLSYVTLTKHESSWVSFIPTICFASLGLVLLFFTTGKDLSRAIVYILKGYKK